MLLYSGNPFSKGARLLARALGIRRIRHRNGRFSGRRNPHVINWGAIAIPLHWANRVRLLNPPEAVQRVSNKLHFFYDMDFAQLESLPPWTNNIQAARRMIENGKIVVERHVLNGHGGVGIRIVGTAVQLSQAPLYVEYIKKKSEFRVHLFQEDGEVWVIDIQQKIRRNNQEPLDWRVRSYANGFMYVRHNIRVPPGVCEAAILAMQMTDLHFGAADVIYNEHQDKAYVLEINTAPGLEGQTVNSYAQAFRRIRL